MRGVNRVILIGTVGTDPDVQTKPDGVEVCYMSLATTRWVGDKEWTDWHRLAFWHGVAATVGQMIRKGDRLFVEGRIHYGSYDRDGTIIPTADIIVQDFVILAPSEEAPC